MLPDKDVIGFAICALFCGAWNHGAKRKSSEELNSQHGEETVRWALMHILEELAKKRQLNRKMTDNTYRHTPKNPMTSRPSEYPDLCTRGTIWTTRTLDFLLFNSDCHSRSYFSSRSYSCSKFHSVGFAHLLSEGLRITLLWFALIQFAPCKCALLQCGIVLCAHFLSTHVRCVLFRLTLSMFGLLLWLIPWGDCFAVGCSVWIITAHRLNG